MKHPQHRVFSINKTSQVAARAIETSHIGAAQATNEALVALCRPGTKTKSTDRRFANTVAHGARYSRALRLVGCTLMTGCGFPRFGIEDKVRAFKFIAALLFRASRGKTNVAMQV
jgi:hypothetical protein